jgi:mono/diheme cytochrome c family protein
MMLRAVSAALAAALALLQEPPTTPVPTPAPPDAAAIVQGVCTACHGLDFIGEHRKDRDGWDFTVRRMIDKGADLGVDDIPAVVDYLAKTFPRPADKPAG